MARTRTRPRLSPSAYKLPRLSPSYTLQAPPFPTLPFDLGVEILCRLPVKSLLQLRCVCKSWKCLISHPTFAKKHLRSLRTDFTRHHLILGYNTLPGDRFKFHIKDCPLLSVFNAAMPAPTTELGYPHSDSWNSIMVTCDGIIIVADCNRCILLWNPSTRTFKESPPLGKPPQEEGVAITLGFGYDNLDRYKLVVVYLYETDTGGYRRDQTDAEFYKTEVKVNTLGTYLWRKIQEFPSCVPLIGTTGRFVSGTLNWLVTDDGSNWFINSLDLGKESYQKLLPPDDKSEPENFLGVLKDCSCVLCGDSRVWNVWLMKEYGNQKSWTKLFSVATELLPHYRGLRAIHISEDDQVLVVKFCSELYLYDSRDGTLKSLQIQTPTPCISMVSEVYVESLISPCFPY